MDRLIDDNISFDDIVILYNAYKEKINAAEFSIVLSDVLKDTKGKIMSITKIMTTSIANYMKSFKQSESGKREGKEVIPEWFEERKKERQSKSSDSSKYDFSKRRGLFLNADQEAPEQKYTWEDVEREKAIFKAFQNG